MTQARTDLEAILGDIIDRTGGRSEGNGERLTLEESLTDIMESTGGVPDDREAQIVENVRATRQVAASPSERLLEASVQASTLEDDLFRGAPTDVSRLRRFNQIRRQFDLPEAEELPAEVEEVGFAEEIGKQFATGRGLIEKVPFAGEIATATYDLATILPAAQSVSEGKATEDDLETLAAAIERAVQARRPRTTAGKVAQIGSQLPTFGVEFGTTFGLGSAARKGATKVAAKVAGKAIADVVEKTLARRGIKSLTNIGAQVAALESLKLYPQAVRRALPEVRNINDQELVVAAGEETWRAIKNAGFDIAVEVVSERSGVAIAGVGRWVTKPIRGRLPALKLKTRRFLDRVGYQGPVTEMLEEDEGRLIRQAATDIGLVDLEQSTPTASDRIAMLLAFSLPVAGGVAAEALARPPKGDNQAIQAEQVEPRVGPTTQAEPGAPTPAPDTLAPDLASPGAQARPPAVDVSRETSSTQALASAEGAVRAATADRQRHERGRGYVADDPGQAALKQADVTYQGLLEAERAAERSLAGFRAAVTRQERQGAPQTREDILATETVDKLPPAVAETLQNEAESQLGAEGVAGKKKIRSVKSRAALLKIVRDKGADTGSEVQRQKRRLLAHLKGDLDFRTVAEREFGVPERAPDPVIVAYLEGATDVQIQAIADELGIGEEADASFEFGANVTPAEVGIEARVRRLRSLGRSPEAALRVATAESTELAGRAAKAREELNDSLDELASYTKGRTFANPLGDPKLIALATKIVRRAVRAGVLTFRNFIEQTAKRIGSAATRAIGPILRREWDRIRRTDRTVNLDKASDVDEIVTAMEPVKTPEPKLAAPASGPARELMAIADALRKEATEPEQQKDADVWAQASVELHKDYAAEKKRLLSGAMAESAVDVVKAQGVLIQEAEAIGKGDAKAALDAVQAAYLYRKQRTEAGRVLRQGRWMSRKVVFLEMILAPPQSVTRKAEQALNDGNKEEFQQILKEWSEYVAGPIFEEAMAAGIDLSNIDALLADRKAMMRALRFFSTRKADYWDKQFEWYSNSLLSGPLTGIVNIVGTSAYIGWQASVGRIGEAFVDTMLRKAGVRTGGARFGELRMLWRGMFRAWGTAGHNFMLTFRDEWPVFLEEALGRREIRAADVKGPSIKGVFGRTVRLPWRSLSSADDLMMTLVGHGEAMALAYRRATDEGVEGDVRESRMMELYDDRSSDVWTEAYKQSLSRTFKERGLIAETTLSARKKIPGLRYVTPFVTTPVSLIGKAVRWTPLGSLALMRDLHRRDYSKTSARFAEQAMAWGALLALMYSRDPEDPWITGKRGTHPYTIRFGDRRFSYRRVDPFATAMGMTVDMVDAMQTGDAWATIQEPFASLLRQMDMKTYLQSLADIFRAMESVVYDRAEPFDAVLKFAGGFFTGFVPNAVRAPIRAAKPTIPERRVFGPRKEKTRKFMERIIQGTEVGAYFNPDFAKIDLWGRERMRGGAPIAAPLTDFLWRLLVPVESSRYNDTIGDRMLYNWDRLHPDERYRPRGASPFVTINGRKVWLTNEQFQEFQKRRGQMAHRLLERYANFRQIDGTNPSRQDMDKMRSAFRDGTDHAKTTMLFDGSIKVPKPNERLRGR